MIVIFGGGIASFRTLDRRQSLLNTCRQIEQYSRTAQKKARVGDKPSGCITLTSYRVSQTASGPDVVSLQAICLNATYTIESYNVPTSLTFQAMTTMNFKVLHGGLMETSGSVVVRSTTPRYQCQFSVEGGGSVSATSIATY